jgi:hypothetical protein
VSQPNQEEERGCRLIQVHTRLGARPRNLFFAFDRFGSMAPPIPEALELYLKMMEGLDLK